MDFKIHVSPESSSSTDPNNSPSNFKTVFDKPITLDQNKSYLIGLDKIESMTYSWYNISEQYKIIKFVMEFYHQRKMILILLILFIVLLNSHREIILMKI